MADQTAKEVNDVRVELVDLVYSHDPSHFPSDRSHAFAYHLKIVNESSHFIELNARKWILEFENGEREIYEGDRIVGKIVRLHPGDHFEYTSYHLVAKNCVVTGSYHGRRNSHESVWVRIPEFHLHIP